MTTTTRLSSTVRAVRFRYAAPVLVLLLRICLFGIHPWMVSWGATAAERQVSLPWDRLQPGLSEHNTQAITIDAPPEIVWQWLVQEGQDRPVSTPTPGWRTCSGSTSTTPTAFNRSGSSSWWGQLAVGTQKLSVGVGESAVTPVLFSEPGRVLVLKTWGAFVLEPTDAGATRLINRCYSAPNGPVAKVIAAVTWDPVVLTLNDRMLLGLKARAEGRPDAPAVLAWIAHAGWAVGGVMVAGLFLTNRRRRYWLVLPIVAALPAVVMSHDVQAGLAGFLAVGISLLGLLAFGRRWWGSFLLIAAAVLLTLLLVSNAYVVISIAFALLALLALILAGGAPRGVGRPTRSPSRAARRSLRDRGRRSTALRPTNSTSATITRPEPFVRLFTTPEFTDRVADKVVPAGSHPTTRASPSTQSQRGQESTVCASGLVAVRLCAGRTSLRRSPRRAAGSVRAAAHRGSGR